MTSKLKCPVCDHKLYQTASEPATYCCLYKDCQSNFKFAGSKELWQALTQAKQDLGIATKAMNQIMSMGAKNNICYHLKAKTVKSILGNALEQIEHKE